MSIFKNLFKKKSPFDEIKNYVSESCEYKNNTWKYLIHLENVDIFDNIEKECNMKFPSNLKELIITCNCGTPEKYCFKADMIRCFGGILNFNQDGPDVYEYSDIVKNIKDEKKIYFGIDPGGNSICYDLKDNSILFYNHETDKFTKVANNLDEFLNSLYKRS